MPLVVLALACALNLLPLFTDTIGGDIGVHLPRMHYYAVQFWQGSFFPLWAFEADGGAGSPAVLFYPPLTYMVSSLLWPLTHLGLSPYHIFALSVAAATLVAAGGCFLWLKNIVSPQAALVGAVLYLFSPYHLDALSNRAAYGELWVHALSPLLAWAAHGIIHHRRHAAPWFALFTAAALLSQSAVAVCVLVALGFYMLLRGRVREWITFGVAGAAGGLLTVFYALPAIHYTPFVALAERHLHYPPWLETYAHPIRDFQRMPWQMVNLFMMFAGFAALAGGMGLRRQRVEGEAGKEAFAWIFAGCMSAFLMFSVSAPLWWLIERVAPVGFPWRMQLGLMLATSLLAALAVQFSGGKKTAGNVAALVVVLFVFEVRIAFTVSAREMPMLDAIVATDFMLLPEFHTHYADASTYVHPLEDADARLKSGNLPHAQSVKGDAKVEVKQWSGRGIELLVDAPQDAAVLVKQRYFPLWQASSSDGTPIGMTPEKPEGYILLAVPRGLHTIRLDTENRWDAMLGKGAAREKKRLDGNNP